MARENISPTSDGLMPSGENWNTAEGFSKLNVLRLLVETNLYEILARFGRQNLEEELPPQVMANRRLEAIERFVFILNQIITNTTFAIKDRSDKDIMLRLKGRIDRVEESLDGIYLDVSNDVTKEYETKINEKHFRLCLNILSDIKQDLFGVLNRASLIYRASEETDLDAIMNSIMLD
jgi:hypothetical protein